MKRTARINLLAQRIPGEVVGRPPREVSSLLNKLIPYLEKSASVYKRENISREVFI